MIRGTADVKLQWSQYLRGEAGGSEGRASSM